MLNLYVPRVSGLISRVCLRHPWAETAASNKFSLYSITVIQVYYNYISEFNKHNHHFRHYIYIYILYPLQAARAWQGTRYLKAWLCTTTLGTIPYHTIPIYNPISPDKLSFLLSSHQSCDVKVEPEDAGFTALFHSISFHNSPNDPSQ